MERRCIRFQEYATRNHASWCRFACDEYGIKCASEELILVSGVVKGRTWATAACWGYSEGTSLTLTVQSALAGADIKWATSVTGSAKGDNHGGPNRGSLPVIDEDVAMNGLHSIAERQSPMNQLLEVEAELKKYGLRSSEQDQTLFIKGYKLKNRIPVLPWPKKMVAHAGDHELPEGDRDCLSASAILSSGTNSADGDDGEIYFVPEHIPVSSLIRPGGTDNGIYLVAPHPRR